MKKLALTSLFLLVTATSSSVFANQQMPTNNSFGGFSGPNSGMAIPNTVRGILDSKARFYDDAYVTLSGHVTKSLGGEMYMFNDGTGEIMVEIDHEDWYGMRADPTTAVTINAEIDQEYNGIMLEVQRILPK